MIPINDIGDHERSETLERITAAMSLYAFGTLGVFLLTAPWTPIWDQVARGLLPEAVGQWLSTGWARGVVSGLGILNLVTAARDAGAWWRATRPEGRRQS